MGVKLIEAHSRKQIKKFLESSTKRYINALLSFGLYNDEKLAQHVTQQIIRKHFIDNVALKNNFMYDIIDLVEQKMVGSLWCFLDTSENRRVLKIMDLVILSLHRGMGFAKDALAALEKIGLKIRATEVKLNVFEYNTPAINLYKKMGYNIEKCKVGPYCNGKKIRCDS